MQNTFADSHFSRLPIPSSSSSPRLFSLSSNSGRLIHSGFSFVALQNCILLHSLAYYSIHSIWDLNALPGIENVQRNRCVDGWLAGSVDGMLCVRMCVCASTVCHYAHDHIEPCIYCIERNAARTINSSNSGSSSSAGNRAKCTCSFTYVHSALSIEQMGPWQTMARTACIA